MADNCRHVQTTTKWPTIGADHTKWSNRPITCDCAPRERRPSDLSDREEEHTLSLGRRATAVWPYHTRIPLALRMLSTVRDHVL